jgi:hypothetical protein
MLKQIFGGAVTTTLPETWLDASTFRVIPDNQEIFVDTITNLIRF